MPPKESPPVFKTGADALLNLMFQAERPNNARVFTSESVQGNFGENAFDPKLGLSVNFAGLGNADIASVAFEYVSDWFDPEAWGDAASVPLEGDDVFIPAGAVMLLKRSPPPLGALTLHGTLRFADGQVSLKLPHASSSDRPLTFCG